MVGTKQKPVASSSRSTTLQEKSTCTSTPECIVSLSEWRGCSVTQISIWAGLKKRNTSKKKTQRRDETRETGFTAAHAYERIFGSQLARLSPLGLRTAADTQESVAGVVSTLDCRVSDEASPSLPTLGVCRSTLRPSTTAMPDALYRVAEPDNFAKVMERVLPTLQTTVYQLPAFTAPASLGKLEMTTYASRARRSLCPAPTPFLAIKAKKNHTQQRKARSRIAEVEKAHSPKLWKDNVPVSQLRQ